jgi:hypothetical protein
MDLKTDMARILAQLNAASSEEPISDNTPTKSLRESLDPATSAMKDILLRLHEVSEGAARSDILREDLSVEKTETGARIGSWDIVVVEGKPTSYNVISTKTGDIIAKDLFLYEAAVTLARSLNEGVMINDVRIRDLLVLEETYTRNRMEAAHYKKRHKSYSANRDMIRAEICEHRHDEAARNARGARDKIIKLSKI